MARLINLRQPQESVPEKTPQPQGAAVVRTAEPAVLPHRPTLARANPQHLFSWRYLHGGSLSSVHTTIYCSVIAGVAALVWFVQHDPMFTILLLMSAIALAFIAHRKPRPVTVALTPASIIHDDTEYLLRDLKSFWIEYTPGGIQELSIETARWYLPYVKIPLAGTDPIALHSTLASQIPEREHHLSFIEAATRLLGF